MGVCFVSIPVVAGRGALRARAVEGGGSQAAGPSANPPYRLTSQACQFRKEMSVGCGCGSVTPYGCHHEVTGQRFSVK